MAPEALRPSSRSLAADAALASAVLQGHSIGGQETCIILPTLRLAFDSGRCPQRVVYQETLCLSHGHLDHAGGLHCYAATRAMLSLRPPDVLCPPPIEAAVKRMLASWGELDGADIKADVRGVAPGDEFVLASPKGFAVRPFATTHVVPSQGYVITSRKQKLKAEYAGLPGQEIKALRQSGVAVTNMVEVAEAAITADTTMDFAQSDAPEVKLALTAKVFFMECTFVDDAMSIEGAREFGHTHLDEIIAQAELFENVGALVLIHFSPRYTREAIVEALDRKLPPALKDKTVPLLEGFK